MMNAYFPSAASVDHNTAASSGGSSAPSASAGPAAVPVEDSEGYKTSRAAAGTLAAAASDAEVCSALLKENCAQTVTTLLQVRNQQ